jgi:hypothetical protein
VAYFGQYPSAFAVPKILGQRRNNRYDNDHLLVVRAGLYTTQPLMGFQDQYLSSVAQANILRLGNVFLRVS